MLKIDDVSLEKLGFPLAGFPMTTKITPNDDFILNIKPNTTLSMPRSRSMSSLSKNYSKPSQINVSAEEFRSRSRLKKTIPAASKVDNNVNIIKQRTQSTDYQKEEKHVINSQFLKTRSASLTNSNLRIPCMPIEHYKLNIDHDPIVINKKTDKKVNYVQNVSLKFLKPPLPDKPGDITIIQEHDIQSAPLPPKIVRQKPPLPPNPPPKIYREKPPKPPSPIPHKNFILPGKTIPPLPRQVITERLPTIPPPPPDIIIERWLGYKKRVRHVIFCPPPPLKLLPNPRNVVIEWESPNVVVNKQYINLGTVESVDPVEYVAKNASQLLASHDLPVDSYESDLQPPEGLNLAANSDHSKPLNLVGDFGA